MAVKQSSWRSTVSPSKAAIELAGLVTTPKRYVVLAYSDEPGDICWYVSAESDDMHEAARVLAEARRRDGLAVLVDTHSQEGE